jgi:hypothetical protein
MHAGIDELLRLRDGDDAGAATAHVHECVQCQAELTRLKSLSADLRELPSTVVPPERWNAIRAALTGAVVERTAPHRRPGWLLPVASAALVLVAVLFTFVNQNQPGGSQDAGPTAAFNAPPGESRQALVAESQRLESLLAALPAEPRLTRAQTALTVADLEDRIQWVDYRLDLASEAGLADERAQRLWRERVDLLNSLVVVRYAEARTVAF